MDSRRTISSKSHTRCMLALPDSCCSSELCDGSGEKRSARALQLQVLAEHTDQQVKDAFYRTDDLANPNQFRR